VPVPADSPRGGLLSLGGVNTAHAHPNESSPIKRGVFVRQRLLCQELAPPPPDIDTTPPGLDPKLTTRERFAKHTASAACSGCHQFIDDVGFGFERFDGIGAYREGENGKPVDASGKIKGLASLADPTTKEFTGPRELGRILAETPAPQPCAATQYFRFTRGMKEKGVDACAAQSLAAAFQGDGLDLQKLMVAPLTQKSFLIRRAAVAPAGVKP
jgi:hypothetical protein